MLIIGVFLLGHSSSSITLRPSTPLPPFYILQLQSRNPVLEVDRISAYKTKFIFLSFGRIIGSESLLSNKYGSLVIERLNLGR